MTNLCPERSLMLRIVDVNVNRTCEGLRVVEEIEKFVRFNKTKAMNLRLLRHEVRDNCPTDLTKFRLQEMDLGFEISKQQLGLDSKFDVRTLVEANQNRALEGLRVIEEMCHGLGDTSLAKKYETIRHRLYRLCMAFSGDQVDGLYPIINYDKDTINFELSADYFKGMVDAGIRYIQYRDKSSSGDLRHERARALLKLARDHAIKLIINDDVALALAIGADGVHLGQQDMPVHLVRRIAPHLIIGKSTHSDQQVCDALTTSLDYIAIGPIFETASKLDPEPVVGTSLIAYARARTDLPIVAIGGITPKDIESIYKAGANAIAGISAMNSSEKLKTMALYNKKWR